MSPDGVIRLLLLLAFVAAAATALTRALALRDFVRRYSSLALAVAYGVSAYSQGSLLYSGGGAITFTDRTVGSVLSAVVGVGYVVIANREGKAPHDG